jgi:transglutaminase-like putative cysteine protease
MTRYRIRHVTRYVYAEPVSLSHNLAHLALREVPGQTVLEQGLEISPQPMQVRRRSDWFGNPEDAFSIQVPHRELTITASAEVVVTARPQPATTPPWDGLPGGAEEFRCDSPLVPCALELHAYAAASCLPGRPVLEVALDLTRRIHADFAYDPGATSAGTPVLDALELRRGVCQDFAQVLIGCLRSRGVPARYVSGYLETTPPPGRPRLVGADATHAWAQVWCGPEAGWVDLDPTNDCVPAERHITAAYGRDFTDVSPVKGMVLGGGRAEVSVGVDVERVADQTSGNSGPSST